MRAPRTNARAPEHELRHRLQRGLVSYTAFAPRSHAFSAFQEVPGFLVALVFCARAVWGQKYVRLAVGGADGEDIPGVGGDDEGGDDVDVARGVGDSVGVEVAFVGVATVEDGALDLDPQKASAMLGGDVVGRAVSPGLGDTESELDGPGDEAKFSPFSTLLGVADRHTG